MPPEFTDLAKWLACGLVGLIAFFLRRSIERVESDLLGKADKEYMTREIEGLKMELKETREARERDIERIERVNSEKMAELSAQLRDRLNSIESHIDSKFNMVIQAIRQARGE